MESPWSRHLCFVQADLCRSVKSMFGPGPQPHHSQLITKVMCSAVQAIVCQVPFTIRNIWRKYEVSSIKERQTLLGIECSRVLGGVLSYIIMSCILYILTLTHRIHIRLRAKAGFSSRDVANFKLFKLTPAKTKVFTDLLSPFTFVFTTHDATLF